MMGTLLCLIGRETRRLWSDWVPNRPSETDNATKWRKLLMGRMKTVWVVAVFPLLAGIIGRVVLVGKPLGQNFGETMTTMLVVLTILGFGAIGLTAASITDDLRVLGRESLWGVRAWQHVVAKFVASLAPSVIMGAATASILNVDMSLEYLGSGETIQTQSLTGHMYWICLGIFILYAVSCAALGLVVSSIVRGIRSVVFILMAVLALLVILSDVATTLEKFEGFGRVIDWASYALPSRYAAGAWASEMMVENWVNPLTHSPWTERGWTWTPTTGNMKLCFVMMTVLIVLYLTVAITLVHTRASKVVLNQ